MTVNVPVFVSRVVFLFFVYILTRYMYDASSGFASSASLNFVLKSVLMLVR